MREITYREAISEALVQAMEKDERVFIMGIGVDDPKGIFGTTLDAYRKFGGKRVFDTPLSENALTGIGLGSAISGMRPVMVHARVDFLLLAMDQIINHAAKWQYMFGSQMKVPLTIRAIIGRGWGQAAQHSQSLQALFAHIPGLKVVMPSSPYDVKGLLMASIEDEAPVIFIEHRWLYEQKGDVPEHPYTLPIGGSTVVRSGKDITIVAISQMVLEAKKAADLLEVEGISAEVIDLPTLRPLEDEILLKSVEKTGRLLIADTGWKSCGVSAEIAARVVEGGFECLKAPIRRIALPDCPTPCSPALEKLYYPGSAEIVSEARKLVSEKIDRSKAWAESSQNVPPSDKLVFQGPF
jgi:pyruvate dehydrogenase E1 component beta subunit